MRVARKSPPATAYSKLRQAVGWEATELSATRSAFDGTLGAVSIWDEGELRAYGRIIGDGGLYYYLQDVMVDPKVQGRGLGAEVVRTLRTTIPEHPPGGFCALLAVPGSEEFYRRLGFEEQTPQNTVMVAPSISMGSV